MNLSSTQSPNSLLQFFSKIRVKPGFVFGAIILGALVSFEIFNYSTTDYALRDLLGNLSFGGVRWATILALAFCGIDFAGIARLFTPEQDMEEPKEVWYLFGAWLLAATMNAMLTWWGVSMAVVIHTVQSTAVISSETLVKIVPIFVAIMVWVIRILIIGTLSLAGDRMLWGSRRRSSASRREASMSNVMNNGRTVSASSHNAAHTPAARSASPSILSAPRPEPTYHNMTMGANSRSSNNQTRHM